ncbi:phosphatidylglycerophosphatase A family protein [Oenococcus oeni]|uniref:phosphatidylglycerophosphatase A family protein n=1 Tax=Oenococcus oeni TaxID=1247 RepID=UPI0008F84E3D|nr:phosphatidylglycerophosphatase A [Oenococcus oeni]OIL18410.1 phosphatidylglycerophosphatase A [Oenococcus oeni]OIL21847.1 phosphatidylglycerophosphatase A [Oenococcus oeni]OIL40976.1 phosphatidylglycerophosphatase A [Oenococcus oeni]OIM54496.1 phosphatidylglycerophosphatase A [Oenococcus oeni]SYW15566.1 putative Phosphatidylglycerophosphatase A [Oenococcus oeni]
MDEHVNYENTVEKLKERKIELSDIAEITYYFQLKYLPGLTKEIALHSVKRVLQKREVQHVVWVALELDRLTEEDKLKEPINGVIKEDFGLFGVDELLGNAIAASFGSIGFTGYGYVDNVKPGIIGKLDRLGKTNDHITTTFADDIIGGIAAAAGSRLAQRYPNGFVDSIELDDEIE